MKTEADVKNLEKLIGQLQSLHSEISQLTKKSSNDGLNTFKLKIVNSVLAETGEVIDDYKPLKDFNGFDEDALPTNSDVTMILGLYMEQIERFRSDSVVYSSSTWQYVVGGKPSGIRASMPTRVGGANK
ncbi:MAG: hypothetical protein WCA85_19845 [Paraburkholderia sp.]|uniref:hypothetical protein n=1 Tax=Paraburkholderia sp. TaxID=1926495 RepID=UPI003C3FBDB4